MSLFLRFAVSGLLCLMSFSATAEILVLIHGYMGDASSWHKSGVVAQLQANSWRPAGNFGYSNTGIVSTLIETGSDTNIIYTVGLPDYAQLVNQADWLGAYMRELDKAHAGEPVTLIGHSAGGVVARLMLVRHNPVTVKKLITIAAPHLGTAKAIEALDATNNGGMFGMFKEWIVKRKTGDALYHQIRRSRGALIDLAPARPGNLLFWLNAQTHPDIDYVSIVRTGAFQMGDQLVPAFSQDMNQIPVLRGKSSVFVSAQGHELNPTDGPAIVKLLKD